MEIRRANADDAQQISSLIDELGYVITEELIQQKLATFRDSVNDAVLVAVVDGRLVGCISLHAMAVFHKEGNFGRVTSFVVTTMQRSQGVGAALLASAHVWFESMNCSKFELTSGDQRTDAHRFYEGHGYRRDGQRFSRKVSV